MAKKNIDNQHQSKYSHSEKENRVSKIQVLPNNWKTIKVKDAIVNLSISGKKLMKKNYKNCGIFPVIDQGQEFIGGYCNDKSKVISCIESLIVFGDHTRIFKFVNFDFVPGADGVKLLQPTKAYYPKLLYYFLKVVQFPNKGYARHFQYLLKCELPLPPLNEQKRIVAKIEELFSKLDAGVESLKKAEAQLRRYRQSVLKAAFEGKLTEKWREKHKERESSIRKQMNFSKKEKVSNQEYAPSRLKKIPISWTWATIGDIKESMKNGIYKPKKFYSDDGIPCLRMYNIEDGKIVWKNIKRMVLSEQELKDYGLLAGDILINRVNSRELVGKSAVIPDGLGHCVYESKNIRLRVKKKVSLSKYVNYWLLLEARNFFNRNAQQTVGMASINQEQISLMPIPLTSLKEQQKIIEEIERRFSIIDSLEKTINSLKEAERLRQAILKKAFEGRLVPQDPNDEPAWKLLERIKEEKKRLEAEKKNKKKRTKKGRC